MITFNKDNFSGNVAYIVENDVMVHSILKELEPFENITLRNDAKIERISLERDGSTYSNVQLANGEHFSAELLVCDFVFYLSIIFIYLFFVFFFLKILHIYKLLN